MINLPNTSLSENVADSEKIRFDASAIKALSEIRHQIKQNKPASDLNGFIVIKDGFDGSANKCHKGIFTISR